MRLLVTEKLGDFFPQSLASLRGSRILAGHWIDQRRKIDVEDGKTARPAVGVSLASLVVQAFPSNCKVFVRRPEGEWKYLDETPAERRVATGDYEIKVQLNPTGETRVQKIKLKESGNAPVRVAFGGGR